MLTVVTGGSASGKSEYAERLVMESGAKRRIYLATMHPWGKEGEERVAKHRRMRAEKNFETIECYLRLEKQSIPGTAENATEPAGGGKCRVGTCREEICREETAILLECMSNLVANEQFEAGGSDEEIIGRVINGIRHLQKQAGHIIIVTNEVFSDGELYDADTMRYIRLLGTVNRYLAFAADRMAEVVCGIPVWIRK